MANHSTLAILLIDDDAMFGEGVFNFFSSADMAVTIVANAKEMRKTLKSSKYSVAILDWNLRDGSHPLESIDALLKTKSKVIVVSDSASGQQMRLCIQAKAHGYLDKKNPLLRLVQSVNIVLQNGLDFQEVFPDNANEQTMKGVPELKRHEVEMLIQYICNPLISYKEIAKAINSGESWVKECMPGIYRKFGAVNRDQLYVILQQHGIIPVITPMMATLALQQFRCQ